MNVKALCLSFGLTCLHLFAGAQTHGIDQCGFYEIKGHVRLFENKPVLKLYEKSMSETLLTFDEPLAELADVFMDKAVLVKADIRSPIRNYRGHLVYSKTVADQSVQRRVSDPLHALKNSGYKMIYKLSCEAKSNSK